MLCDARFDGLTVGPNSNPDPDPNPSPNPNSNPNPNQVGQLTRRQTLLQTLYETRVASLQRLVAFMVVLHAMGKRVEDFWRAASPCLGRTLTRTLILTLTLTPILTRARTLARRAASLGLLAYDCWRSQSRMRIATTASPVSGSEVPSLTRTLALSPNPRPTPHPP